MALRKRYLKPQPSHFISPPEEEIPIADVAEVLVTSEAPHYPVEHLFDLRRGPAGSQWRAETAGHQALIVAFDVPQSIRAVQLEIEEVSVPRTQELVITWSGDGGATYHELVRQEYTFSPPGTTFERERWEVALQGVTHLWVSIKPDKGQRECSATMTSLVLLR